MGVIGLRRDTTNSYRCKFATDRGCAKRITGRPRAALRRSTYTSALLSSHRDSSQPPTKNLKLVVNSSKEHV
ncbi:hypothetical protein EVAR_30500_1 [Eumeta japonica]|uniref:Uncharacterized protein n=1 Tax=Eumeta variegata TaxID=151549 RepID=A0A4C1VWN3_EUMVA|nr:hypothetical protein EVAR_30500_1 [Eumeta japonica]